MSESRRTGLLRLKHLQEICEAKAEEMTEERQRFNVLAKDESAPRVVSSFNLFQTPPELAARVAGMFEKFGRTLEPSAGLGRLYRAVREIDKTAEMTLVDSSTECCRELYHATHGDELATLVSGDFLEMGEDRLGRFDSIIMNPPFKMVSDIRHILHARQILNKGGTLVSICANGPRQRAALKPIASRWIDLPPMSFRESGTGVETAIVVIKAA